MTPDMLRVMGGLRAGFGYKRGYVNPFMQPSQNQQALEALEANQLVRRTMGDGWVLTERGNVLLDHMLALPLPVSTTTWTMPEVPK